jgi:cell division topological specificity factor
MDLLSFLFGDKKKTTAAVAKERLLLVVQHERAGRNAGQPDYLQAMKDELVAVISKYVKNINPGDIKFDVDRKDNMDVLAVKIELPEADK